MSLETDLTSVTVNDTLIGLTGPVQSNSNDTNSNDTNSNDTILGVGENWTYTGNYTVTRADITSNGNGTGFINNNATVNLSLIHISEPTRLGMISYAVFCLK